MFVNLISWSFQRSASRSDRGLPTSDQLPRASQAFSVYPPSISSGKRFLAKSNFSPAGIWSKTSGLQTYIPVLARFEKISPGLGFSLNRLIW